MLKVIVDPLNHVVEDEEFPKHLFIPEAVNSETQESAETRTRREVVAFVDLETVRVQLVDVRADDPNSSAERPVLNFVIEPEVPTEWAAAPFLESSGRAHPVIECREVRTFNPWRYQFEGSL